MESRRIAVIGAGIAGAATAFFLTRRGFHNVVLIERESVAGAGSTGRNAAILRTLIPDTVISGLARESADFYRDPPDGLAQQPLLDPVGLYLCARRDHSDKLLAWAGGDQHIRGILVGDADQLYARVPLLARGLDVVVHQPREGVLDVHAILQAFLKVAMRNGAELRLATETAGVQTHDGRVTGVVTSNGTIPADRVVIACGGWAESLGRKIGCPLKLTPFRRHLLVTEPSPEVDPRWPVVWVVGDEFYFRPESGGLLMSACDAEPVQPEQGETTQPDEIEKIARKARRWLPSLDKAGVVRAWAGMRTFAADEQFVIGPDPRMQGLFWVAGLGGHGITCAPTVGAIAAECVAEGVSHHPSAAKFLPARLL